ncbi:hypothetical protein [Vibrio stylophorae]|nr:hypothetical protein [Vibrio stylophorae]
MKLSARYQNLWRRAQRYRHAIGRKGLPMVGALCAFSLFFVIGLATLGLCLFAGVFAMIGLQWRAWRAKQQGLQKNAENTGANASKDDSVVAVY